MANTHVVSLLLALQESDRLISMATEVYLSDKNYEYAKTFNRSPEQFDFQAWPSTCQGRG